MEHILFLVGTLAVLCIGAALVGHNLDSILEFIKLKGLSR